MKFRETELVELNFVTASRVNSRLTTHECRDESQICNYQRMQFSNNKFINGESWGVRLTWLDYKLIIRIKRRRSGKKNELYELSFDSKLN